MDIVYGLPAVVALVLALIYVRRIALRERESRPPRRYKPKYKPPSLSQRSEMRAGEKMVTVMEEIERTHSGALRVRARSIATPSDKRSPMPTKAQR